MHRRRRGQGRLDRPARDRPEEIELLPRVGLDPLQPADRARGDELVRGAVVFVEAERRRGEFEPVHRVHEMRDIGGAAELPVGHRLETDLFLHGDGIADAAVLDRPEPVGVDLSPVEAAEPVPQRIGTQQAADMLGPEGRGSVKRHRVRPRSASAPVSAPGSSAGRRRRRSTARPDGPRSSAAGPRPSRHLPGTPRGSTPSYP